MYSRMEKPQKPRVGRPPLGDKALSTRFNIRISARTSQRLDMASELLPACVDHAEVVRHVLEAGLDALGVPKTPARSET